MRFRSGKSAAGQVFAVSGVNTISFGIAASDSTKDGLLGFAVERVDPDTDERFYMPGFKVFASVIPHPEVGLQVSTFEQPVQSFLWDDFTAKDDHAYTYVFHPLKGKPRNLDRTNPALSIQVRTEPLVSTLEHDVFFNRGVASSQAYVRNFGATPVEDLKPPAKRDAALKWLSRDLDEAILRFIGDCGSGDRLLGCFYEFSYRPVADALKAALDRGVDIQLIIDAKINEHTDKEGFHESFPREENLRMLAAAGIPHTGPDGIVMLREARKSDIAHNKFMVRLVGGTEPTEVWTGSTNLSLGGIHGQTNVGHWVRNPATAALYTQYWALLHDDPGGAAGDPLPVVKQKNAAFESAVETMSPAPADPQHVSPGIVAVFSPRPSDSVLRFYGQLLDSAETEACITLAFTVSPVFKEVLKDNTSQDHLTFMLLEKRDVPDPKKPAAFVKINASNNVYEAWGSFLRDPVYQWARETNAGLLGLNQHVSYIHSKFMLVDPLSGDPIVVTGSANFSTASVKDNDENMLIIRGDRRVADIYLTEFNRLFNHYYFRSVTESLHTRPQPGQDSLFLVENASWLAKYAPGTLRSKRLAIYTGMAGFDAP